MNPSSTNWLGDAVAHLHAGHTRDALRLLEVGLQTSPPTADAWAYMASPGRSGSLSGKSCCSDGALEIDSQSARAWGEKAGPLLSLGRWQEAFEAIDQHFNLATDHLTCALVKGTCWGMKGRALLELGRYQEAVRALDTALSESPGEAHWIGNRAICLNALSTPRCFVGPFDRALAELPERIRCPGLSGVSP